MEDRIYTFIFIGLFCLLAENAYAKMTRYVAGRDTTRNVVIYFDLNGKQVDSNYPGNDKAIASLDSLLANPASADYLSSLTLTSPALSDDNANTNIRLAGQRSEAVKVYLQRRYPRIGAIRMSIREGQDYWGELRQLVAADPGVPNQEDVLALIDYHRDRPEKLKELLQRLNGRIPFQYIADRLLPKMRRTEITLSLSYPQEMAMAVEPAAVILPAFVEQDASKVGEMPVAVDEVPDEAVVKPVVIPIVPEREVAVTPVPEVKPIPETEPVKQPETETAVGKEPAKERKTVLALKNNLLYDLALAPNIEVEIPLGSRWSMNTEYKCPWWANDSKELCYQLLSGGIEGRCWLGNRLIRNRLTGHFFGLYAEGGVYDFQFKGDGYQGEYYGAAGLSYGYVKQLARHWALEFSFGVGYLITEYRKYTPYEGSLIWMSSGRYTFIGPTKAKISLVWLITTRR